MSRQAFRRMVVAIGALSAVIATALWLADPGLAALWGAMSWGPLVAVILLEGGQP